MVVDARAVITIRDGRGTNTKDESTVDMTTAVSTFRDLQIFLERALKAAKALREESNP
jgi:hypothetical protein